MGQAKAQLMREYEGFEEVMSFEDFVENYNPADVYDADEPDWSEHGE